MSFLDTLFARKQTTQARVVGKKHIPSFTYNALMPQYIGKTLIFIPRKLTKDEEYKIQLEFKKQIKEITISKKQYDQLQLDNMVSVEYKIGSFSNEVYAKKIVQ